MEVHDGAPGAQPRKLEPALDEPGGRGLAIVAALASRWGTGSSPPGKLVWFELDTRF